MRFDEIRDRGLMIGLRVNLGPDHNNQQIGIPFEDKPYIKSSELSAQLAILNVVVSRLDGLLDKTDQAVSSVE